MYPYLKPLCFSFLAFFLSFGLTAQQTISGRVFHGDGSEQIGAIVCASYGNRNCMPSEPDDSLSTFTFVDGSYTLTLPDSIAYLYFDWDGMVNPVVPIAGRDTLNLINAEYWEMAHDRYPEEKIPARTHAIQVTGIVVEFRKKEDNRPLAGATLTPMVSPKQPLASVTSDAEGHFSLTIPPEAGVLRMQYKWVDKYYVLPPVRTLYVPFLLGVGRDMKLQKKRRKQWERQQRKGRN